MDRDHLPKCDGTPFDPSPPAITYWAVFQRFLRFGCQAFGGPAAQIAMIRRELVETEGWVSTARFNRLLAVMQALPGPEAHELCVHLGIRAKGRWGGVLAGLGFMLPGLLIMLSLAAIYGRLDMDAGPVVAAFAGAQAAVLALIGRAMLHLGRHTVLDRPLAFVAVVVFVGSCLGAAFWILLPLAGLAYGLWIAHRRRACLILVTSGLILALLCGGLSPDQDSLAAWRPSGPGQQRATLLELAFTGLKTGLLTFGGAYTAIPFLRGDALSRGWMTEPQFLDGIALAGVLPAPLIIFATFVGYAGDGLAGALAMTAGVFLPAFAFSLLFYERLERLTDIRSLWPIFRGVAAGAVGMIAATGLMLAANQMRTADQAVRTGAIMLAALVGLHLLKGRFAVPVILISAAALGVISE